MLIYDDDNLTAEEMMGGFDIGQADDETFYLERQDQYPGVLPDFAFDEKSIARAIAELEAKERGEDPSSVDLKKISSAEEIKPEEGESPWDYFDKPEEIEDDLLADDANEAGGGFTPSFEGIPEGGDIDAMDIYARPKAAANEDADDALFIDDELRYLVESELERSKKLRESDENDDFQSDGEYSMFGDSTPNSQSEADTEISFDEVAPDTPSQATYKSVFNEPKESSKVDYSKIDDEISKNKDKKKKERKPMPLWQVITLSSVASVLVLGLIGFAVWKFILNPDLEEDINPENKEIVIRDEPADQTKKKMLDTLIPKGAADIDTILTAEAKEEAKSIEKDALQQSENESLTSNNNLSQDIVSLPNEKKKSANASEIIKDAKQEPTKQKQVEQRPKSILEFTGKKPEQVVSKKEYTETKQIAKPERKENKFMAPNLPKEPSKEGLFTIQIYSSPSKNDAEKWLEKLKERNIGGEISPQIIRDEVWYRVRFGQYKTKEDAQAAAIQNGFTQSWVDRIR